MMTMIQNIIENIQMILMVKKNKSRRMRDRNLALKNSEMKIHSPRSPLLSLSFHNVKDIQYGIPEHGSMNKTAK